ncbi:uncharacterized protein METZ01_LOCUS10057 [marine metagenome]|uniref:Uncharacterized protein n=1 Tax=marine metagenome TaxID=408172 RepID=A0A381NUP4_9ZZZZ
MPSESSMVRAPGVKQKMYAFDDHGVRLLSSKRGTVDQPDD